MGTTTPESEETPQPACNDPWLGRFHKNKYRLERRLGGGRRSSLLTNSIRWVRRGLLTQDSSGSVAHNGLLSQLLNEIDTFESSERLFVFGTTNMVDTLDPALTSRLSEYIEVALPGRDNRKRLFQLFTRDLPYSYDIDFDGLAQCTDGPSGRDIETICQRAARSAFGRDVETVANSDFAVALSAASSSGKRVGEEPLVPISKRN